ncbi:MAG: glycosyltransferase family 2 protein [Clostridium sp.]|jgi:glycosyltransferase involved in cell wall biosynthesis|uniref:glycosyltransferase family 2 protein n=1 Tax=Clostridium sp. TaxID=1506 RepID=UPI0025C4F840|nr:glycosyltransferase family 2 protein [Clostridium sp.]MCH3963473.1 glycosyltransferase family 2 protein [Clostridium sp.]MCI1714614.1 glycosyltransferase family 2 protein [Clostridium sp.]MCI1799197.1 glycosyltransferase family 2 protein [Clostridium sp.]MCI1812797.1 glycosyltransferase family 2 protein [Clostridium sp.]MCI1869687.1 glycosyltransferase family 2 protein [Clostridium sp.]
MLEKVSIVLSTYNNEEYIRKCLDSCFIQDYEGLNVIVADDGSTDGTLEILRDIKNKQDNMQIISLTHGERGIARNTAIELAKKIRSQYIYIIDSDMILEKNLIKNCMDYFSRNRSVGALIIPEYGFSNYKNFYSKVKVFERNIINNSGEEVGRNSIEAARFWRIEAFNLSGGINADEVSFEEIQPTIRYMERGGKVKRAVFTRVYHDEKFVMLKNILMKKRYYFSVMDKTIQQEEKGLRKTLQRWYFFRTVLYTKSNLKQYLKHPLLTLGVLNMYLLLTIVGIIELIKIKVKRNI